MKKGASGLFALSALLLGAEAIRRVGSANRYPVNGRVVLITGSSRGLGLALAERFARAGARLVLTARSQEELERARATLLERGAVLRENVLIKTCDVRANEQVQALFRFIEQQWSPVEVLVNNAGVISVGPVVSQPLAVFENAMQTNYFGMLHCSLAALPAMLHSGSGAIVNIASIGGKVAVPHLLPYSASKFACVGFSQGLHAELSSRGVRVTTVTPGLMRTGSPVNAEFTGRREQEFRWFNIGASLPGISRNAYAAAGRILRAAESGEVEFSITPQAAVLARVAPLVPALSTRILALVNRLILPSPTSEKTHPLLGRAVTAKDVKVLTGAGKVAERLWNQS